MVTVMFCALWFEEITPAPSRYVPEGIIDFSETLENLANPNQRHFQIKKKEYHGHEQLALMRIFWMRLY